jgi:hypothetical protein
MVRFKGIWLLLTGLVIGVPIGACLQYYKKVLDRLFKTHKNKI